MEFWFFPYYDIPSTFVIAHGPLLSSSHHLIKNARSEFNFQREVKIIQ